jgi:hypothetical protein
MSTMFDYIGSIIIFAVLAITVARVQMNINSTVAQNSFSVITQQNSVGIARQVEHDFLKIGYHVSGQKIFYADTAKIVFKGDLQNVGTPDSVIYAAGTTSQAASTQNPRDFPLFRTVNGSIIQQNWGLTSLYITYFDSNSAVITPPVLTTARCNLIRGIDVRLRVESPAPVYTYYDTTWSSVAWEKLLLPRNLWQLNY